MSEVASGDLGARVLRATPSVLISVEGPSGEMSEDCTTLEPSLGLSFSRASGRERLSRFFIDSLHLSKGVRVSIGVPGKSR